MLYSLRGVLLILGVLLPLLKVGGLPLLAVTSWFVIFAPLMSWAILFAGSLIARIIVLGGIGAALLAVRRGR